MAEFDTIRDELAMAERGCHYADLGALAVRHAAQIIVALNIAANVTEAGLRADLECGHVVPESEVVSAEDADICRACAGDGSHG